MMYHLGTRPRLLRPVHQEPLRRVVEAVCCRAKTNGARYACDASPFPWAWVKTLLDDDRDLYELADSTEADVGMAQGNVAKAVHAGFGAPKPQKTR